MANFIEELFYNNINPQARMIRNGSDLQKQLGLLSDYEKKLTSTLKDDEKKLFLAFANAVSEVQAESQLDSFFVGFRLGVQIKTPYRTIESVRCFFMCE